MRVGVVGTVWINTPPQGYGGTEGVIYNLVSGLVKNGHDVTLFGPGTAKVPGKLVPTVTKPLRDMNVSWTNTSYTLLHLATAFERAEEFDILHVHLNKSQDLFALPLACYSKTPVLFTLHFRVPTKETDPDRYAVLFKYRKLPFTSISNAQRRDLPVNFIATVYNSLHLEDFPFQAKPEDCFVWLGKVNPLKGTKEAILAAKEAGVRLFVLGAVDQGVPAMKTYYEEVVKRLIDGKQIVWVGEVSVAEKGMWLGKAKAFLNPILWEEPFGLVMAEAQAVGTPVISFNRGAAPEVIVDGKTGFLVDTQEEMIAKMKKVDSLDRRACRKNVEEKFSVEKMTQGYERAYEIAIKNWKQYTS